MILDAAARVAYHFAQRSRGLPGGGTDLDTDTPGGLVAFRHPIRVQKVLAAALFGFIGAYCGIDPQPREARSAAVTGSLKTSHQSS